MHLKVTGLPSEGEKERARDQPLWPHLGRCSQSLWDAERQETTFQQCVLHVGWQVASRRALSCAGRSAPAQGLRACQGPTLLASFHPKCNLRSRLHAQSRGVRAAPDGSGDTVQPLTESSFHTSCVCHFPVVAFTRTH